MAEVATIKEKSRIERLAEHRKTPAGFIEDRRSVYWVDKKPPTFGTKYYDIKKLLQDLNERQLQLVETKKLHKDYQPDRPSPMWRVPRGALRFQATTRLTELAKAKPFHKDWVPMRSVYTTVPRSAIKTAPTKRLSQLAQPKSFTELQIRSDSNWEWGEWASDIPKTAMTYNATARIEQLSEAKSSPSQYVGNRSVLWPVAENAKQAQATTRLSQLARPKTRQALDQDYDPYRVSYAARMAVPSPRVEDLCKPIPRKVRSKK